MLKRVLSRSEQPENICLIRLLLAARKLLVMMDVESIQILDAKGNSDILQRATRVDVVE